MVKEILNRIPDISRIQAAVVGGRIQQEPSSRAQFSTRGSQCRKDKSKLRQKQQGLRSRDRLGEWMVMLMILMVMVMIVVVLLMLMLMMVVMGMTGRDGNECHVQNWTTERILTMEYIHGCKVNDLECLSRMNISPASVSQQMCQLFAQQIFEHGFVHCDPHPGNVLVRVANGAPQIVLLDHGLYRELDDEFRF